MKQKFTMYVLNVYKNEHNEGEWLMKREDFDAELLNEGTYHERYDADEFMIALKRYTTQEHLPMTREQMLRTSMMDIFLDKPQATLEPDGVTASILFKGEPSRTEHECIQLLKDACEDCASRDYNGARTQLETAQRRKDLSDKRERIVYEAFKNQPEPFRKQDIQGGRDT